MSEVREDGAVGREVAPDERRGGPPGADVAVEEPGPGDEELSPWFGDLDGEDPESQSETDQELSPDVPESPKKSSRSSWSPDVDPLAEAGVPAPYLADLKRRKGKRLVKPEWRESQSFTPEQRVLILDTWMRCGLSAGDFAPLVRLSTHTLYSWKKRFEEFGPAGLMDKPRGTRKGSKLPEATRRAILMLKEANPDYGVHRISEMLVRGPALPASPGAVSRVLHEAGFVTEEVPTVQHKPKATSFEREQPNQLWQTDIFTFTLKRTNRRVYLVAFMDDHSRFVTSFGLHASASTALVIETLEAGIASFGPPHEILTDNGPQYVTWRGKSAFAKHCEKRGIRQIVSKPKHPQTLGKIERFWGTLWRECVQAAIFVDLGEARHRVAQFIDHYNFQRVNQGIDGLVPADRFFCAAPEVLQALKSRVAANALEIARHGQPKTPFYVTGNVGGKAFCVHSEGERLLLKREGEEPKEIELAAARPAEQVLGAGPEAGRQAEVVAEEQAEPADAETPSGQAAAEEADDEDSPVGSFLTPRLKQICDSLRGADGHREEDDDEQ